MSLVTRTEHSKVVKYIIGCIVHTKRATFSKMERLDNILLRKRQIT